jgi:outer membrane protein insertion porin family/translocation and assembly module TamA
MLRWVHVVTTLLLALLTLGCPAKLPAGATALDKVSIDGTDDVDESDLKGAMASQPTSKVLGVRMWWVDYGLYDPTTLEKDLQRIERFYQARGYYEARARAGRVVRVGDRSVRVQIVLEEGVAVHLARIQVTGTDKLPEDVRTHFAAAWKLAPGDNFDEELYRASGAAVEQSLTDDGYAHASVTLGADVDLLKHEAVIRVEVAPGPKCTFGAITITGLSKLDEDWVRRIIAIKPGEEYSTRTMRAAQNALFDLGTFDTVTFEPSLSDPNATVIPVKVATSEAKLRRIRIGPGFLFDPLRSDVHVTASWEHRNFLGGLRQFRAEVRPMMIYRKNFRPGIIATTELRQPGFLEARTAGVFGLSGGLLPDPVNDYQITTAMGSVGVDRRFLTGIVYAGLFYRKAFQIASPYGGVELPPNAFDSTIGYLEALATIDARDDLLKPTRGYFAALSTQYAIGSNFLFLGGDFGDVRLQPEIRMYGPIAKGIVLAFRFTTGFLLPYNYNVRNPQKKTGPVGPGESVYEHETRTRDDPFDKTGAPPAWRAFYSGGAIGNRGYPVRYVGLRDCQEEVQNGVLKQVEFNQDCSVVVGGASLWESSVELRFDVSGPFSAVLFMDASDVSRRAFDLRLDYPHLSAGPGLRYHTPIGPVRLDLGFRIPGAQRIGGQLDPRGQADQFGFLVKGPFALHFSVGEAF